MVLKLFSFYPLSFSNSTTAVNSDLHHTIYTAKILLLSYWHILHVDFKARLLSRACLETASQKQSDEIQNAENTALNI